MGRSVGGLFLLVNGSFTSKSKDLRCGWEREVAVVHTFFKDEIPRLTVNQLLKRLVREICRLASVRASHHKVCIYSTGFGRNARYADFEPHRGRYGSKLKGGKELYANTI